MRRNYISEPVQTIYFGGGTPSVLTIDELRSVLLTIKSTFDVIDKAEITLEANPEDISPDWLKHLTKEGVNRLSLGIQSLDPVILRFLNRNHTQKKAIDALNLIHESDINNYSVDLIYGIPGLSTDRWQEDLNKVLDFQPPHLSCYALTIEESTVFGRWKSKNKFVELDESQVADQFMMTSDLLTSKGYAHYEVSNFALPGFESCHNRSYWRARPYLGVGPSAHSYNLSSRQFNVAGNIAYIRSFEHGPGEFEIETLTRDQKINEYILTSLRTNKGVDMNKLKEEFSYSFSNNQQNFVKKLVMDGLASYHNGNILLSRLGYLYADKITLELMADPS